MVNYVAGGQRKISRDDSLTFEHVRPVSLNGSKQGAYNLVLTCNSCNNKRGNGELKSFKEKYLAQVNLLCMHLERALHERAMETLDMPLVNRSAQHWREVPLFIKVPNIWLTKQRAGIPTEHWKPTAALDLTRA